MILWNEFRLRLSNAITIFIHIYYECLISIYTSTENWEGNGSITGWLNTNRVFYWTRFVIKIYDKSKFNNSSIWTISNLVLWQSRFLSLYKPVIVRLKIETDLTDTIFAKIKNHRGINGELPSIFPNFLDERLPERPEAQGSPLWGIPAPGCSGRP